MLSYAVHGQISGELFAPVSKSDLHRLILACALSSGSSLIRRCTLSEDIRATARVMEAAGASVTFGNDNILVRGTADATDLIGSVIQQSILETRCSGSLKMESGSEQLLIITVDIY